MLILRGEEDYEYLASIHPGDVLTEVTTIIDGQSRQGKNGTSMDIVNSETRYNNQHTPPVLNARKTMIVRE